MRNRTCTLLLTAALLLPIAALAQDHDDHDRNRDRDDRNSKQYYDSRHRDWHNMGDHDRQGYSSYAEQHHFKDHDFDKASEREQQQYWNYRHKHQDSQ